MIGSPAQSNQTEDDAVEATDLPESYHVWMVKRTHTHIMRSLIEYMYVHFKAFSY